jgi:hypothetical protein
LNGSSNSANYAISKALSKWFNCNKIYDLYNNKRLLLGLAFKAKSSFSIANSKSISL